MILSCKKGAPMVQAPVQCKGLPWPTSSCFSRLSYATSCPGRASQNDVALL
jgi:hypothetical protein